MAKIIDLDRATQVALLAFEQAHGRTWRQQLRDIWENGRWTHRTSPEHVALLQALRNSHGNAALSR